MIVRGESTIIGYYAPFDQGFIHSEKIAMLESELLAKQICH